MPTRRQLLTYSAATPFAVWLRLVRVKVVSDSGYTEGGLERLPTLELGGRKYMRDHADDYGQDVGWPV